MVLNDAAEDAEPEENTHLPIHNQVAEGRVSGAGLSKGLTYMDRADAVVSGERRILFRVLHSAHKSDIINRITM